MQLRAVIVIVWHGQAYIPVQAQYESGLFTSIEPVLTAGLTADELMSAVRAALSAGHPRLPNPTREEVRRRKDPVLKATKVRSVKELMASGTSYAISWTPNEVRLDVSSLDSKGRWINDPRKMRSFRHDAPLEDVVSLILEDARSRPELFGDAPQ